MPPALQAPAVPYIPDNPTISGYGNWNPHAGGNAQGRPAGYNGPHTYTGTGRGPTTPELTAMLPQMPRPGARYGGVQAAQLLAHPQDQPSPSTSNSSTDWSSVSSGSDGSPPEDPSQASDGSDDKPGNSGTVGRRLADTPSDSLARTYDEMVWDPEDRVVKIVRRRLPGGV